LFVKVDGDDFSQAQRKEIEFTPNRVQKKIVEFARGELRWAKEYKKDENYEYIRVGEGKEWTKEEWYKREAEHATELFEIFTGGGFPQDRLIRIDESGDISVYPLDYPMYGAGQRISHPQRRSWWQRWFGG
jgi:hypothetical protein